MDRGEVYTENDLILGCKVEVRITDDRVFIQIGGRDHDWDRKTGKHLGSGVALDTPVPQVKNRPSAQIAVNLPVIDESKPGKPSIN